MRKLNAVLAMGITALFLVHAITGAFQLMGVMSGGSAFLSVLSWVMLGLIVLHVIISVKLTVDTVVAIKRAKASYFKENKLFWIRRISGLAVMLFIVCHVVIFMGRNEDGAYRLALFEGVQLATQILLVLSLALHILSNIRPLMLALGVKSFKDALIDAMLVLSVIMLFAGAGFAIYWLRWNVF
ncbi:MAG: hypothetical protein IJ561_05955 [Ruminococcus sp.]|nr:hypothetical protein [Ruminococcus sp.]